MAESKYLKCKVCKEPIYDTGGGCFETTRLPVGPKENPVIFINVIDFTTKSGEWPYSPGVLGNSGWSILNIPSPTRLCCKCRDIITDHMEKGMRKLGGVLQKRYIKAHKE